MPLPSADVAGVASRKTISAASFPTSCADASSTSHDPVEVNGTPSTVKAKSGEAGPAHDRLFLPSRRAVVTTPPVGPAWRRHSRRMRPLPSTAEVPLTLAVTGPLPA